MTQEEALAILKTGASVFLTGEPGSGKSHTINRFVTWLREHDIRVAITASTGIAATHISGSTIHSWSGIGVRKELTKFDLQRILKNKSAVRRIRDARTLIIDEISMLSANTFTLAETTCRVIRGNSMPFGGLQVVLVGDFFQLPPIIARDEEDNLKGAPSEILMTEKQNSFAFNAPAWHALNLHTCYLSEQYRQDDTKFLEILSAIRSGRVSAEHRNTLETRLARQVTDGTTQFFSHNAEVDRVNSAKLEQLSGEALLFAMESHGPKQLVLRLKNGCLSPETLALKVGARVMFTKNDTRQHRFVNGTLGTVIGFSKENDGPIVKTNTGLNIVAEPVDWSMEEGGRVLASVTQIPLRLAWAITVHKSQGMSLDAAHMDLRDTFEYGQGYVAISRVRTLAGLSLVGFNERALEVHPDIAAQDIQFREASRNTQEHFESTPHEKVDQQHNDFIVRCGGSLKPIENITPADHHAHTAKTLQKEHRWEHTLTLIREGKSLEETAGARGRKTETILQHLEELLTLNKLRYSDISHLARGKENIIAEIHNSFEQFGIERLKPTYDAFNGRFPYQVIRLARLLFKSNGVI
ncbi:MAG: helix-turn-helix domain-containing protein [Patescibacteria group bacterium]